MLHSQKKIASGTQLVNINCPVTRESLPAMCFNLDHPTRITAFLCSVSIVMGFKP
uniref:Uncharacterized protein n=1 Tax=Rhizophora mucronata TaxID=61149 RepID=A0A2P2QPW8_RHIMU